MKIISKYKDYYDGGGVDERCVNELGSHEYYKED